MVNEEYKEKVREKYGKCSCGADVEYVILRETTKQMYHINMFGELSHRYEVVYSDTEPELVEGMCLKCYQERGFDKTEEQRKKMKEMNEKIAKLLKIPDKEEFEKNYAELVKKNEEFAKEGEKSQLPSMDKLLHRFDI